MIGIQTKISEKNINDVLEKLEDSSRNLGSKLFLLKENDPLFSFEYLKQFENMAEYEGFKLKQIYGIDVIYIPGEIIKSGHFAIVNVR